MLRLYLSCMQLQIEARLRCQGLWSEVPASFCDKKAARKHDKTCFRTLICSLVIKLAPVKLRHPQLIAVSPVHCNRAC
jgi:hypothetical protein